MSRFLSILILTLTLLPGLCCHAQKQASIWYFGDNAGIDFRKDTPQPLNNSAMFTIDASAVIADANGNLLFYTNGVTVWDRNHAIMPHGKNLWGNSSTQTLIIPQPGNDSIFFIFTVSAEYDYFGSGIFDPTRDSVGFHYTVVNMHLNNGLGDVIEKNTLLFRKSTEKMSAVFHANGNDVWLVAHEWESNAFRSYLITNNGIDTANYVVSNVGVVHSGGQINENTGGQMKLSPDGKKIAVAIGLIGVQVFDFNSGTGVVSNPSSLIQQQEAVCSYRSYRGIEFSPNVKFLYYNAYLECPDPIIYLNKYDIQNKRTLVIDKAECGFDGYLQLAIDGRIYISIACDGSNTLGVIENPNQEGMVNLNRRGYLIGPGGGLSGLGLPNFIQSYFLFPDPFIEMPNVFSPNGDLYNEHFVPMHFENINSATLTICNRWGEQVFYTDSLETGWDGGSLSVGTYYWFLSYLGKNGKSGSQKGWVQLIR